LIKEGKRVRTPRDLTGMKFGHLTVLQRSEEKYISPNQKGETKWVCECDCENKTTITIVRNKLITGHVTSCGCHRFGHKKTTKKQNTYVLSGKFGIGYTANTNKEFYFDLEDYDKINQYCWHENSGGYVCTVLYCPKKIVMLHKLVMGCGQSNKIDHKDRNKTNNRKDNLRNATAQQNSMNTSLSSRNTTGVKGVYEVKSQKAHKKWRASITLNYKTKHLGDFLHKEDAIVARLKAEKELFGEFAPQRHLFDQYKF